MFCITALVPIEVNGVELNNYKSSYYRLLITAMFIIVSLVVTLGVLTVSLSTAVYKSTKLEQLRNYGDVFISCYKDEFYRSEDHRSVVMMSLYSRFSADDDYNIYVYDGSGKRQVSEQDFSGDAGRDVPDTETISAEMMRELDVNDYLDFDNSHISKNEPYILYGTQFFVAGQSNSTPSPMYAAVYEASSDINSFTIKCSVLYFALGLAGTVIAYFLLKRRIRKQSAFEYDFMRISEMYAKGDFSETIRTDIPGTTKEIAEYVNAIAANVANSEETSKTFIANVSHELRTPMTTIGGFVDGILDGTIPKSRQNEYLVLVSKEIKRLRILISSMLNMSRFESGTLSPNFKDTNITDLVIQTVLMFEKKIDDKHLEVEGLGSGRIDAEVDADLMQQVIYNLVENAVKFIDERGTLSFRFEKLDGMVTIGIKNTGEGLTNEEIAQVFDRFYKTDSSRGKDTTGLGLGLSISRKIVHLHDGHIVVKSVHGEYTEFLVEIPEKRSSVKKG